MPQTNKCLNSYSRPLVVFQDVSTRHDWLVRWVCEMTLGTLTDLWILCGPGTTEDIGAATFLFVNGRCHLEKFWPVIESDSIKTPTHPLNWYINFNLGFKVRSSFYDYSKTYYFPYCYLILGIYYFSKIQLAVYYQCCVLIGWATTRLFVIAR